jgi:hypothetical protein
MSGPNQINPKICMIIEIIMPISGGEFRRISWNFADKFGRCVMIGALRFQ